MACVLVTLPNASLHNIYTVAVPTTSSISCAILDVQLVQLSGLALLPYATSIPHTHPSVPHVTFKVTPVVFVVAAPLLIKKDHHVGGVISTVVLTLLDQSLVLPSPSLLLAKK